MKFYFEEIDVVEEDNDDGQIQISAEKELINPDQYTMETAKIAGKKPTSRGGSSLTLVHDHSLVLIGGADREARHYNDVHVFNTETNVWKEMHPKKDLFSKRSGHSAVAHESIIYVFGGINLQDEHVCNDLWALNLDTQEWKEIKPSGKTIPSARNAHAAVLIPSTESRSAKMLIYGGSSPMTGPCQDVYVFHFGKDCHWEKIETTSTSDVVPPRELHTAAVIVDSENSENQNSPMHMIVYGGRLASGKVSNELWSLDLESWIWTKLPASPTPGVCAHSMFICQQRLVSFGGWDGQCGILNECWEFHMTSQQWTKRPVNGTDIAPRFGHAGCSVANKGYLVGGMNLAHDISQTQYLSIPPPKASVDE